MVEYRKYLLNKYPSKTYSNYIKLNQNLEKLKQKRQIQVVATQIPIGVDANVRMQTSSD